MKNLRKKLNISLEGDSSDSRWGVMDALVQTNFPDIRIKCFIKTTCSHFVTFSSSSSCCINSILRRFLSPSQEYHHHHHHHHRDDDGVTLSEQQQQQHDGEHPDGEGQRR